jgi:aspartyl-tRNA(Asn)/glutamyl-tRNA(Gln) amidotransferase subunit B
MSASAIATSPTAATGYEPVIGVEVHVQLATSSKMFCGCPVQYGAAPNTLTCPVCQGQPGALPAVNARAVEMAVKVGLALNCSIATHTKFDRKNYFYPDLPKGYQISQYDRPICHDGHIDLPPPGPGMPHHRVRVQRAHMEEDTGKSIHMDSFSLLDYNRCGTPLVEIVSEPDMHSADEAHAYLTTLKRNLSYLDVSPLSMEKGSLRCDLNVSLRPLGDTSLPGYKVEVKNLNSFSNARAAIQHEIARQATLLNAGRTPEVETRLWDADRGETRAMRSKELANDYRYFPEPDLPALRIDGAWVEDIRGSLPEMPDARVARFTEMLSIKLDDAAFIVGDRDLAAFFEACVAAKAEPQKVANWLTGEVARAMNHRNCEFHELGLRPEQLIQLLQLTDDGKLNNITAKEIFPRVLEGGEMPLAVATAMGKLIEHDDAAVDAAIGEVMAEYPKAVEEFRGGKTQTLGFLVGQTMRKLRGKADPKQLGALLESRLKG